MVLKSTTGRRILLFKRFVHSYAILKMNTNKGENYDFHVIYSRIDFHFFIFKNKSLQTRAINPLLKSHSN